jgi:L-threonylcarbamoyladenylate synthase
MKRKRGISGSGLVDLQGAVAVLKSGGLIVMPTDTVYGVAAHTDTPGSREKLYEAKKRDGRKPIPVLVAGLGEAERRGGEFSAVARDLVRRFWPGPLTIVVPNSGVAVGYRMPDHSVALELIRLAGGALYVTSANLSGSPPADNVEAALQMLAPLATAGIEGGPKPAGTVSTVVRVDGDTVEILRAGAISRNELNHA